MVKVKTKLVSWDEIVSWSKQLADKVKNSGYKPDIIIAVARGGYVPARLICDFLGIENLVSVQSQHWTEAAKMAEKAVLKFGYKLDLKDYNALLVDDIVDTGESLLLARDYILKEWKPKNLKIAVLQWISPVAKFKPDYYVLEVKEWVWFMYPWTRLEDVTQFIKRMLSEEGKVKRKWMLAEIASKFMEWYGQDVGDYLVYALEKLIDEGFLQKEDDVYIIR